MAERAPGGAAWSRWVVAHPRWILAGSLLLVALAGVRLAHVHFDTDMADLLPGDDPQVVAFLESQQLFNAESVVFVLEDREGPIDPIWAERLAEQARRQAVFRGVDALPFALPEVDVLLDHVVQLVPAERREQLLQRLGEEGMRREIRLLRRRSRLAVPGTSVLLGRDPLGIWELLPRKGFMGTLGLRFEDGVLLSPDRRALLIFGQLGGGSSDEKILTELLGSLDEIRATFRQSVVDEGLDPDRFSLSFTGPAVIAGEETRLIRRETFSSFGLSLVAVMALFAVAFRRVGAFLWLALPLGGAVVVALSLGDVLFSGLSLLTASTAALMVGLGIDFGIHLYTRALDRRVSGMDPRRALRGALEEVTGANFYAALTSGLAFGTLALSAIPGIRDMGLLAALGLMMSFLSMTLVFPSMLLATRALGEERATRPIPHHFVDGWLRMVTARPAITVTVLLGLTLVALPWIPRIEFGSLEMSKRLEVNPALQAQEKLVSRFGSHFRASVVVVKGEDSEAVEEANRRLLVAADSLLQEGHLSTFVSPFRWIPTPEDQRLTLEAVQAAGPSSQVAERLEETLREQRLDPAGFGAGIESLVRALEQERPIDLEWLLSTPEVARLTEFFALREGNTLSTALFFLPTEQRLRGEALERIQRKFEQVALPEGTTATLVTPNLLSLALRSAAQREVVPAVTLASAAILLVLFVHLRRPRWVFVAAAPLAMATIWLLGVVGWLGVRLSVENIAAVPMILGIGIDDALHLLHHVKRHPERSLLECLAESGKAVILTTVTTVLAFATLVAAGHPTLRTLGLVTGLGVTFCLFTTMTVIPLATGRLGRHRLSEPLEPLVKE